MKKSEKNDSEKFVIYGGNKLSGKLKIKGAKNAILPILSASILCGDVVEINNVPKLVDIDNMLKILRSLGCKAVQKRSKIIVDSSTLNSYILKKEYTEKLRASIFMLGSILATQKKAQICHPGGCNIGNRPIDIHLVGLESLGVKITEKDDYIYCDGSNMKAGQFYLRFPSVGATENLMISAVLLDGETVIQNCAKEPEIVDLQNFLNSMGANVSGAGTSVIKICGVKKLHGTKYNPIGDRIVAGTYLIATLMTGGDVELSNINPEHLESLIKIFASNDCKIICKNDTIKVQSFGKIKSIPKIETNPYPLFPTDLQPQMMVLQAISDGKCELTENLFETRFKHIPYLKKMRADIEVYQNTAVINGVKNLYGTAVEATDLRAGACLVLAGLVAKGKTTVSNIYHIDRGYDKIEKDLKKLGANIQRIKWKTKD